MNARSIPLEDKYLEKFGGFPYIAGIDIFPLDNVPKSVFKKKIHKVRNYYYIKMIERKTSSYIVDKHNIVKVIGFRILDILTKFTTLSSLKKSLVKNCIKYNNMDSECVCNLGGMYGYDRETTKKEYFLHTKRVPFETEEFDIIKDYDKYLSRVYGDYMQIPPVGKRHVHNFVELDFGDLFLEEK